LLKKQEQEEEDKKKANFLEKNKKDSTPCLFKDEEYKFTLLKENGKSAESDEQELKSIFQSQLRLYGL
jgi:hypothetical protein